MKKFNQMIILAALWASSNTFAITQLPAPTESKTHHAHGQASSEQANPNLPAPVDEAKPIDGIVAIVNNEIITQSQLDLALIREKQQLRLNRVPNIPPAAQLRKMVLEKLIYQHLQLEIAKRAGILVTDSEVDQAINNIAHGNHLTLNELKQKVVASGLSFKSYKKDLKRQLLINKVRMQAVGNKVNVTPADVANYLKQYRTQNKAATQYHVYDLLIPVSDSASAANWQKAKQQADEVIAKLKKHLDIYKVAVKYKGNDLGWRALSDLPNLFAAQIQHMSQGDLAGPLKAGNGYHILKLLGVRESKVNIPNKQQVLIILRNQQFQQAVIKWLKQLRHSAYVKVIDNP